MNFFIRTGGGVRVLLVSIIRSSLKYSSDFFETYVDSVKSYVDFCTDSLTYYAESLIFYTDFVETCFDSLTSGKALIKFPQTALKLLQLISTRLGVKTHADSDQNHSGSTVEIFFQPNRFQT